MIHKYTTVRMAPAVTECINNTQSFCLTKETKIFVAPFKLLRSGLFCYFRCSRTARSDRKYSGVRSSNPTQIFATERPGSICHLPHSNIIDNKSYSVAIWNPDLFGLSMVRTATQSWCSVHPICIQAYGCFRTAYSVCTHIHVRFMKPAWNWIRIPTT